MKAIDFLKEFLHNEGFRFEESDGLINFKVQGVTYFAFTTNSRFLQIMILCNIPDGFDRGRALEICNELNRETFVSKMTLSDDKVWCSWEFEPSSHTTADDFMSIFAILDNVSDKLLDKLNE